MNDKVGIVGIQWKPYKAEGLDLEYAAHFLNKKEADVLFKRLESELVYYSGELTKVKVFGKWHDIPRQQVIYRSRYKLFRDLPLF
jgi:alpha-ketoglutarate-dependent dioxygenase alkB family protein 2